MAGFKVYVVSAFLADQLVDVGYEILVYDVGQFFGFVEQYGFRYVLGFGSGNVVLVEQSFIDVVVFGFAFAFAFSVGRVVVLVGQQFFFIFVDA